MKKYESPYKKEDYIESKTEINLEKYPSSDVYQRLLDSKSRSTKSQKSALEIRVKQND